MPIVGVICPMDESFQSFETCINCHEHRSKERNCHAPVFVLKSMRDNHLTRKGAGVSASTLIGCPRAVAIEDEYDLYEPVISGYNKSRGSWTHAMFEDDLDPPVWVIRERRLYAIVDGMRITGKPDMVDTKYHVLEDYKSKDNLPRKADDRHEFQFNIYAYLLARGYWADTNEAANIEINTIGAHYVTWKTKTEKAWLKMSYPVWDLDYTEELISKRAQPLKLWFEDGIMPACGAYVSSPYWKCDCEKWEIQLRDRGVWNEGT